MQREDQRLKYERQQAGNDHQLKLKEKEIELAKIELEKEKVRKQERELALEVEAISCIIGCQSDQQQCSIQEYFRGS